VGEVTYILLGWLLTVAACYSCGALLLWKLGSAWSAEEEIGIRFVAGAAIYSGLVFVLGLCHLYYKPVFIGIPVLLLLLTRRVGALALPKERLPEIPMLWRRMAWLAAPFVIFYFCNALAPEVSPDGSSYHLGLVAKYYREGRMAPVTTSIYAALSQGIEMLFLSAFAVGRHSAAALIHFTYLLALPWMMACYGRRYGMPGVGVAAALLVFVTPVVGIDGISAYNDVASACLLFTVFSVLRRLQESPDRTCLLVTAGILCGFAYGIKYTLYPALILGALWIVWIYRAKALPKLVMFGAVASAFILPWMLRNALWYRNPLAPFFNNWFPNPYVQYWFEIEYRRHMSHYALNSWSQIPYEVTIGGAFLNGLLGPLFLLAPVALFALRRAEGRRLLIAALFFLSTYFSNIGTRFLIPALPFVAMAMLLAIDRAPKLAAGVVVLHAILSWPNSIPLYSHQYAWRLNRIPVREALRIEGAEAYIDYHLSGYSMARRIEELVPAGRRVMGFGQLPEAYLKREFFVAFQSAEGNGLRDIFLTALVPERQPVRRVELRIPQGKYRALRAVQNRDESGGQWSVSEMRIYNGEAEIPRSPLWRLRAHPTPHEVQKAFDNSEITRWLTDHGRFKGMYLEVDFGREETADTVALHISTDQPWDSYHVEAMDEQGKWSAIPTELKTVDVPQPRGLRRAAVEELLRRDVNYLVINQDDFGYDDLALHPRIWGVEEIAEARGSRLYRLLPRDEIEKLVKKAR
jgi:hypothetical protein